MMDPAKIRGVVDGRRYHLEEGLVDEFDPAVEDPTELARQRVMLQEAKLRVACEASFYNFFVASLDVLEPETEFIMNWHYKIQCDEAQTMVERVAMRRPKPYDLIINEPPRNLKSLLWTVTLNAWAWIKYPHLKFLTASYDADLAITHAVLTRSLIQSEWYQNNWRNRFAICTDQNVKSFFRNDRNGHRIATGTGGMATGLGGNIIIMDDIISAEQSESQAFRDTAIRWMTKTMTSRLNNPECDTRVLVMQRLHEDDPTGYLLNNHPKRWKLYCLPAEMGDNISPPELRKFYVNGLMFSRRFGHLALEAAKADINDPYAYAGQYNQRPSPAEGEMFKRMNWRFWFYPGQTLPPVTTTDSDGKRHAHVQLPRPDDNEFDSIMDSCDSSFKNTVGSDEVAMHKYGKLGANKFLLDRRFEKMDYPALRQAIIDFAATNKMTSAKIIEDKGNGPAIIADLQNTVPGLIPYNPKQDSKTSRAQVGASQQKAGNIYLPHPANAPWVKDMIEFFCRFPRVKQDHDIDAFSQYINSVEDIKYIWQTPPQVKDFSVDFEHIKPTHEYFVSVWADRNFQTGVVAGVWDGFDNVLKIYASFEVDAPAPELVLADERLPALVKAIAHNAFVPELKRLQWWGGSMLFKGSIGDINASFIKGGIYLRENDDYNEAGGIIIINRLLVKGKVEIHSQALLLSNKMQSWSIVKDRPDEFNYPCCRALTNIASSLYDRGKIAPIQKPPAPYSNERQKILENNQATLTTAIERRGTGWMGGSTNSSMSRV